MRLALNGFRTYDERDGLGPGAVHSIFEGKDGDLFAVSGDWFINLFRGKSFTSVKPRVPAGARFGWASQVCFLDSEDSWWLLTSEGLLHYERVSTIEQLSKKAPAAVYTTRNGLPYNSSFRLFNNSRGDVWVSLRSGIDGGLAKWERASGKLLSSSLPNELSGVRDSPTGLTEDRSGNLWMGFYTQALARVTGNIYQVFTESDGVVVGGITSLHLDRAGRLWATSKAGGLCRIDDPAADHHHYVQYTTKEGLSSNNARCITEDLSGRIYVGTVRGVDRLDPATGQIKRCTTADGLGHDFVMAAFCDSKGILWFGTSAL